MPFTKVGKDDYTSPSGRHFNSAQVRLYHANGGKFPGQKSESYQEGGAVMHKGYKGSEASYAQGGAVLGRTKDFLKTPDYFRENKGQVQNFAKGGGTANPDAKDKSVTPVKPKS